MERPTAVTTKRKNPTERQRARHHKVHPSIAKTVQQMNEQQEKTTKPKGTKKAEASKDEPCKNMFTHVMKRKPTDFQSQVVVTYTYPMSHRGRLNQKNQKQHEQQSQQQTVMDEEGTGYAQTSSTLKNFQRKYVTGKHIRKTGIEDRQTEYGDPLKETQRKDNKTLTSMQTESHWNKDSRTERRKYRKCRRQSDFHHDGPSLSTEQDISVDAGEYESKYERVQREQTGIKFMPDTGKMRRFPYPRTY